jgi:hypothetical protein
MIDGGRLSDYFGPYSPYMDGVVYNKVYYPPETACCIHLICCPACGFDTRLAVKMMRL